MSMAADGAAEVSRLWGSRISAGSPALRRVRSGCGSMISSPLPKRAQGCSVVRWITAADNSTARSLYDQLAVQTNWVTYDAQR